MNTKIDDIKEYAKFKKETENVTLGGKDAVRYAVDGWSAKGFTHRGDSSTVCYHIDYLTICQETGKMRIDYTWDQQTGSSDPADEVSDQCVEEIDIIDIDPMYLPSDEIDIEYMEILFDFCLDWLKKRTEPIYDYD